ncbi:hypothetical protein [Vibrio mediterranei]|jgi:hypothetical protein|uniref:Uncharacterized protein n=1 Tax=Vibrio mediterranei TaxID=689 RepID=A0ABX5DBZ9_9VIBR|nr:hypothetical protein [Vibrio mediterranei]MCG9662730.1 hypothetical protein [Vibrio mediterranei]PCD88381.1 hypothetical protein COR52_11235 [Vibrio mediterranei]PRQ66753.1 hypothetical protein COR51_16180 [Vibrio mediterranei]PTC05317.1 hypothetical protein C9980_08735 [Vibrio mediterranei]SBO08054.1 hypothetical protein VME0621_00140 [Vibrio mediterranei]
MGVNHYDRKTLVSGYWTLHNFHYGHVAEAKCELSVIKRVSIHKTPSDPCIHLSIDILDNDEEKLLNVYLLADQQTILLNEFVEYQCVRGVTKLIRFAIPPQFARYFTNEEGFRVQLNDQVDEISTAGAGDVISNAIRYKTEICQ